MTSGKLNSEALPEGPAAAGILVWLWEGAFADAFAGEMEQAGGISEQEPLSVQGSYCHGCTIAGKRWHHSFWVVLYWVVVWRHEASPEEMPIWSLKTTFLRKASQAGEFEGRLCSIESSLKTSTWSRQGQPSWSGQTDVERGLTNTRLRS